MAETTIVGGASGAGSVTPPPPVDNSGEVDKTLATFSTSLRDATQTGPDVDAAKALLLANATDMQKVPATQDAGKAIQAALEKTTAPLTYGQLMPAVEDYQRAKNLKPDSEIGAQTMASLLGANTKYAVAPLSGKGGATPSAVIDTYIKLHPGTSVKPMPATVTGASGTSAYSASDGKPAVALNPNQPTAASSQTLGQAASVMSNDGSPLSRKALADFTTGMQNTPAMSDADAAKFQQDWSKGDISKAPVTSVWAYMNWADKAENRSTQQGMEGGQFISAAISPVLKNTLATPMVNSYAQQYAGGAAAMDASARGSGAGSTGATGRTPAGRPVIKDSLADVARRSTDPAVASGWEELATKTATPMSYQEGHTFAQQHMTPESLQDAPATDVARFMRYAIVNGDTMAQTAITSAFGSSVQAGVGLTNSGQASVYAGTTYGAQLAKDTPAAPLTPTQQANQSDFLNNTKLVNEQVTELMKQGAGGESYSMGLAVSPADRAKGTPGVAVAFKQIEALSFKIDAQSGPSFAIPSIVKPEPMVLYVNGKTGANNDWIPYGPVTSDELAGKDPTFAARVANFALQRGRQINMHGDGSGFGSF